MGFNSLLFVMIYVPLFVYLMFLIKNNNIRNILIMIFSILFYLINDIDHFFLLLIVSIFTYFIGLYVYKNKYLYLTYLIAVVALLFFFKYANSVSFIDVDYILMPLGISFYLFTAISYVSDVYCGRIYKENSYLKLLTYLSFFITITSGPILRYQSFNDYLKNKVITEESIANGFRRFVIGLFKKVVIANQLAHGVSVCFNNDTLSMPLAWFGAICFMVELYYDFSGYSDMAIGLAYMIGCKIPENFNNPYVANSIRDFWHRWHISLSLWFKEYVYIPLGGSRVSTFRWLINVTIVWCLTGIWHGSTTNYLLWGLWNCLFLILEKFIFNKIKCPNIIRILFTQLVVLFGFVIFNTSNLNQLSIYISAMLGKGETFSFYTIERLDILYLFPYLFVSILFIIPSVKQWFYTLNKRSPIVYDILTIGFLFVSFVFIVNGSYSSFIYAGF